MTASPFMRCQGGCERLIIKLSEDGMCADCREYASASDPTPPTTEEEGA